MTEDIGVAQAAALRKRVEAMDLPENMASLLDEKAAKLGDAIAANFFDDGVEVSYRELAEKTHRLANSLLAQGIRKRSHVAVMVPNSEAFVVTWFALVRIGAIMVPVNNRYLSNELEYVLNDADAQFLVIDESCFESLRGIAPLPRLLTEGAIIAVGQGGDPQWLDFHQLVEKGDAVFIPPVAVSQSDLASIQYTSGTTGFPKGCMQPHLYWLTVGRCASIIRSPKPDVAPLKNILIFYSFNYMMADVEFMLTLYSEGTAFISRRPSLKKLVGWIKKYKIHYCAMNPMVYRGLPANQDDHECELQFIAAYYHKGKAHAELERRFNATGRDGLGMTEVGSGTFTPVGATHMADKGTCGLASPFREALICDEHGNELPPGETGELCLTGAGLFLGYYKKPKANRESFHGRWFRTGDLATMDENGYVFIVGRIKEMIKRSGENISAAEVEAVLREHVHVYEAAAVAVPDEKRMEEVKVYVSLRNEKTKADITPDALIEHCKQRLAPFKIPRYFAYVDDFPRTGTEKIAKPQLVQDCPDLRLGAYDRVEAIWRD
jgi:acyl-CoA synthetase (AMP-forming)/AMP-acid ligase II